MQITIVKADNFVSIDGVQKDMDLSFLPEDFHALQFDGKTGSVESNDIDKCEIFDSITKWSKWTEFDAKAKTANNTVQPIDIDDNELEEVVEKFIPTLEDMIYDVRSQRDYLLQQSDVEIIRLVELDLPISEALKVYRQGLRDLPNKIESGQLPNPVWDEVNQVVLFNYWPVAP